MRFPARHVILVVLAFGCISAATQTNGPDAASGAAIRLEAHEGQTRFQIGDPVFVDLVFTRRSAGYSVDTDSNPAQPSSDAIYVTPDGGWVRSHQNLTGKGINGNALVPLGEAPVRVPVLINRVIDFQKPGDYDISIATQRLVSPAMQRVERFEGCDPCPSTNAVRIHLATRSESDEAPLVASLSEVLEKTRNLSLAGGSTSEQMQEMARAVERFQQMPDSPKKEEQQKVLIKRMLFQEKQSDEEYEKRQSDRRLTAERLAYLTGDDAVRAKIHFIAQEGGRNDADVVSFIMINGLSASGNKQLQLDLLEALWRDPEHVPNDVIHSGLRDARLLSHDALLKDPNWGVTSEERAADLEQYKKDLEVIVATLPSRSEENRAQTIKFLKMIAIPNRIKETAGNGGR